jgi:MFS family permease
LRPEVGEIHHVENLAATLRRASGDQLVAEYEWWLQRYPDVTRASQNGAITHISALLTDRAISPESAALAVSAMGGAVLAGRLITGCLLDRFFAPRAAFCLFIISALGTVLLAGGNSLTRGITPAALIGFGMGGEGDVTPYLLSRYFGLRSFSTFYGLSWTAYAIAGAAGPIIMGRAFDLTGSYRKLLLQLSLATLAAASLLLLLPRYDMTFGTPRHDRPLEQRTSGGTDKN